MAARYVRFAARVVGTVCEWMYIVIDKSTSMRVCDIAPSRIQAATAAGCALLDVKAKHHPDDKLGIIAFASGTEVVQPLMRVGDNVSELKRALHNFCA